jgi:hypothetical protein
MNLVETLVNRTFEMQRAGAYAFPLIGPNKAIASMMNKFSEIGTPNNLNTLALRMVRTLQRVARLQVTISPPELPTIMFPRQSYQEAALEEAYPSIEEPLEFDVTRRFDPLTSIIRRMVQSFLRRLRRPKPEEEPSEPPPSKRERAYTIPEYIQRIVAAVPRARPRVSMYPVIEEDKVPTISPFHPLQEYVTRASRLAGIVRPGVPTYPVIEEDKVPTISPFHPLQEYVTRASRLAGITKVELPTPGEEEIRIPTPTLLHPLQEYIDITAKLAEGSKLEEPIISIEEEVEEITRAPLHPIKAYLDLASGLGELLSARAAAVYGITAALPEVESLEGERESSRTFDFLSVVKEIVTSKVEAEKTLATSLGGVVSSLVEIPVGEQALERVGLEVPVSVPSPRLLDIMPVLSRVETISRAQRPPTVRRERASERRRPIEIKVEPKIGDIDLRELERKIARILREEARRYGVY